MKTGVFKKRGREIKDGQRINTIYSEGESRFLCSYIFSADIKSQSWRTSMELDSKAQIERCREISAQLERRWALFLLLRRTTRELEKQIWRRQE